MITFNSETPFNLKASDKISFWIEDIISSEGHSVGEINYIFCDDAYLSQLNKKFLDHDTLTDIISFDYCVGKQVNGDIYISIDRVSDNAETYGVSFDTELNRVMIHGILHYLGYKDKTLDEKQSMRAKEDLSLSRLKH
ncbi:MAG: rRNA maturation RNase YbeY [Flavobacteriaceae bacterium]